MSFQSIKAEADAIGGTINKIIQRIRTATIAELYRIEEALGLAHPEVNTFNDFDNRLGTIVERLHHVEPENLNVVSSLVPVPAPASANVIPLTPEVKETGDSADTSCDVAAPSGASAEAHPTPDQAVS